MHDLITASPAELTALLAATPAVDVWGIGVRLAARLARHGLHTAADLARANTRWLRRLGSVGCHHRAHRPRTARPALPPLTTQPPPRRQMLHTRHLGQSLTRRQDITDCAAPRLPCRNSAGKTAGSQHRQVDYLETKRKGDGK